MSLSKVLVVAAAMALPPVMAQAEPSLYAADMGRTVKALSPQETDDLLAGRGMGLARAAELNGWPGPAHALELSTELGLRPDQIQSLKNAKAQMSEQAKVLGSKIVEEETALDRDFASSAITPERLQSQSESIAVLQGQLRAIHLAAHLTTRAALTEAQTAAYNRLRGYQAASPHKH